MRTEVATSHLRVTPGTPAVLDVEVTNTADVIEGVTASIQGLDPSWVSLVVPVVSLFPEATTTISLRIDLPTNCLAGEYLVSVRVQSIVDLDRFSETSFWLTVEPYVAGSMELHPSIVVGGREAFFQVAVVNQGNVTLDVAIDALEQTREISTVASPPTLSVAPGETHLSDLIAEGKRPWFGQSATRTILITATGPEIELEEKATFTQKPRIPRGVLTLLILAGIIALWATVFLFVVNALRDTEPPTKLVAAEFNNGGNDEVNLEAVGASVEGSITAESNGAPVPLITAEAFRVRPDGSLDGVGSSGSDEEGIYTLESLLPGSYKLRFSGEGYTEIWYPAAPDSGSAGQVSLDPASDQTGLNVVMAGMPGSLSGQVLTPEGSAPVSVTITQVLEQAPVSDDPAAAPPELPVPMPAAVDGSGVFFLGDLVTPGEYQIDISSPGFQSRTILEALGAGENKVINTVTMGAAPGSLAGQVTDGAGQPLGGVTVTVRSGEFQATTTTPTAGNVGTFVFQGLETPRTYVLTFTLAGYTDLTIALDLASGQNLLRNVQLLGGQGTASGVVSDSSGVLLGGAEVVVAGGGKTFETATLTESGAVGQQGSWSVTALPTPGVYTVTVSSPGFDSQTVRILLPSAGSVTGINTVLPRSTGNVVGTATTDAGPVADVIVELSDGTTNIRSTATASTPPGAYRFADVAPGSYTLTFRRTGLVTQVVIVDVVADQTINRDVRLPTQPVPG